MKKEEVVKNSREFDTIIKKEKYQKNDNFVIYYKDNGLDINRFGISVGKKTGNAVTRNYYKRIIRNICDKNKNLYSKRKDYIIIVRSGISLLSYQEINDSFIKLMDQINNRKGTENEEKD